MSSKGGRVDTTPDPHGSRNHPRSSTHPGGPRTSGGSGRRIETTDPASDREPWAPAGTESRTRQDPETQGDGRGTTEERVSQTSPRRLTEAGKVSCARGGRSFLDPSVGAGSGLGVSATLTPRDRSCKDTTDNTRPGGPVPVEVP